MNKYLGIILLSIAFTVLGIACGWFGARQTSAAPAEGHGGHGHGEAKGHGDEHGGHEGHDHGPAKPKISAEAAKNLGVTVGEAKSSTYFKYQAIPASVTEVPATILPLVAPIGGTVGNVNVKPNMYVESGTVTMAILREALPRPTLTLTDEIIKPASEQVHTALGDLRRAQRGVDILKTELERVKKFTTTGTIDGLAILPKKNEIDLRYDLSRAEQEQLNAREKLSLHGFSAEEIAELEAGKQVTLINHQIWKRALQRNGLWSTTADVVFESLAAETKTSPWSIAAIGELSGAGLLSEELGQWLKEDQVAARHFLEIAGMLQQGHSLKQIQSLRKLNVMGPIIQMEAPKFEPSKDLTITNWDVREILVKPLQRVEAGAQVAVLASPSQVLLKSEPVGSETMSVLKALKEGSEIEATPLVAGTGPHLKGLKLSYATSDEHAGTVAYAYAQNEPLHVVDGPQGKFRTWQLRSGQRYMFRIPTEKLEDVFVFPSDAVTEDGPDKVVFIQDGDSYKTVKVVILHHDQEVAVIDSKSSEIFDGDIVVQHGAFALGLALKAGAGGVDPHAGHNH